MYCIWVSIHFFSFFREIFSAKHSPKSCALDQPSVNAACWCLFVVRTDSYLQGSCCKPLAKAYLNNDKARISKLRIYESLHRNKFEDVVKWLVINHMHKSLKCSVISKMGRIMFNYFSQIYQVLLAFELALHFVLNTSQMADTCQWEYAPIDAVCCF